MDLYYTYRAFKNDNPERKILAATYNHRGFNIHEKNYIKALIDHFNFDHLMLSIRPSALIQLKQTEVIDFDKFRHLSQVIFVLQTMARYDVQVGLISNKYLEFGHVQSCNASLIYSEAVSYLEELRMQYSSVFPTKNYEKVFCSLNSIHELKDKLAGKVILFHEYITDQNKGSDIKSEIFLYQNQISELEKDIFWIGFDSEFKEVPWDKPYLETKWNRITEKADFGYPLYGKQLRYCNRCCMPETMEGITFDEFGICTPCRSSEEKMHINWEERELKLRSIVESNRSDTYYDCMLPMSGGKDSTFQAYVLTKRYGVSPLAVTHGANWMSLTGRYNLENCLQKFDMDHLIFHANRAIINKVARKSLKAIGDACWHCHIGAGTFVIQSALAWNVGIMIWGESIAERDGRGSYINQTEANIYYNLDVSGRVRAQDYVDKNIPFNDLAQWFYPEPDKIKNAQLRYLHLGDFIFWDEEKQVDFVVRNFEWRNSTVENAFKGYKSNECVMAGVHDYANFIKRGIGRATVQASDDVRRGIITREEGFELAKMYDSQRPHALDFYLKITGYSEEEFEKILIEARSFSTHASKLKTGNTL
jgi:N-acetyl sugar amidotransferase